jgi:hypothetical protein
MSNQYEGIEWPRRNARPFSFEDRRAAFDAMLKQPQDWWVPYYPAWCSRCGMRGQAAVYGDQEAWHACTGNPKLDTDRLDG